jgi:hypothetical protein
VERERRERVSDLGERLEEALHGREAAQIGAAGDALLSPGGEDLPEDRIRHPAPADGDDLGGASDDRGSHHTPPSCWPATAR